MPLVCRALNSTLEVNETFAHRAVRSSLWIPMDVPEQELSHPLPRGSAIDNGTHTTCLGVCARPGPSLGLIFNLKDSTVLARPLLSTTAWTRLRKARPAGRRGAVQRSSGPRCADAGHTRQERPQAAERLRSPLLPAEPRRSQAGPAPGP